MAIKEYAILIYNTVVDQPLLGELLQGTNMSTMMKK